jgi:hypothetical protein
MRRNRTEGPGAGRHRTPGLPAVLNRNDVRSEQIGRRADQKTILPRTGGKHQRFPGRSGFLSGAAPGRSPSVGRGSPGRRSPLKRARISREDCVAVSATSPQSAVSVQRPRERVRHQWHCRNFSPAQGVFPPRRADRPALLYVFGDGGAESSGHRSAELVRLSSRPKPPRQGRRFLAEGASPGDASPFPPPSPNGATDSLWAQPLSPLRGSPP